MGLLWFFLLYVFPTFLLCQLPTQAREMLQSYTQVLSSFAIVIVFFVVVSELLTGTIFQHVLNIGKALVFMAYFIYALNGGSIAFDFESMHIEADLTVYLAMLLVIDLLGLAKSLLQAINFLVKKTESQLAI